MRTTQDTWFDNAKVIARFFWSMPKTQRGWLTLAGNTLGDYAITRQKARWENLTQGFDSMDSRYMGKGSGKLIAGWMQYQREATVAAHLARLEAIVLALDEQSLTPLEKAMNRFIASKVSLVIEGYSSKLKEPEARYQRYLKQAKVLLSALPMKTYRGLSQKAIYLGEPFHPESLFVASHRFLESASVEGGDRDLQLFLNGWESKKHRGPEDFYGQLIALTHRQEDPQALASVFEVWFESYRDFMLQRIETRERWMNRGMNAIEGRWLKLPKLAFWK